MPTRTRRVVDSLASSKAIPTLLKVLNEEPGFTFRVPGWPRFRADVLEDLRYLWNGAKGNPPAAENSYSVIMGVRVPHPRLYSGVVLNAADFNHDQRIIRIAFACRRALDDLARTGRADLLRVCEAPDCGTFLFGKKRSCKGTCRTRKARSNKASL